MKKKKNQARKKKKDKPSEYIERTFTDIHTLGKQVMKKYATIENDKSILCSIFILCGLFIFNAILNSRELETNSFSNKRLVHNFSQ